MDDAPPTRSDTSKAYFPKSRRNVSTITLTIEASLENLCVYEIFARTVLDILNSLKACRDCHGLKMLGKS